MGYIPNDKISYLFRNALAFIFPSIYEGFGIPIIEAMAVGAPVITTIDGGATREVAGDTALLFRKYDYEVLAIKMAEIIENNELRERLIAGGKERAKLYTWKRTAELTLDLYQKLMGTQISMI